MITFPVDDVTPATTPLPTEPLRAMVGDVLTLVGDADMPCAQIEEAEGNLLYLAAVEAYRSHRPLTITPDAVWLTIGQGVATHVQQHAEQLRDRFVSHSGQRVIKVEAPWWPSSAEDWMALLEGLAQAIDTAGEGRGWPAFFLCDFSTSTPADRMASQVILLEAHASFYRYFAGAPCGIPSVTLTGTPEDWRAIRRRADRLLEIGLEHWAASLLPILDELVSAAEGRPRRAFWQEMVCAGEPRCGQRFYGWLGRLFPILWWGSGQRPANHLLDVPHEQLMAQLRAGEEPDVGLTLGVTPWIPARATIHVAVETGGGATFTVTAGLRGIAQDSEGRLCAHAAVEIRPPEEHDHDEATWERIAREHTAIPAAWPRDAHLGRYAEATLRFGDRWVRVLPARSALSVTLSGLGLPTPPVTHAGLALPDGGRLARLRGGTVLLPAGSCLPPDTEAYRRWREDVQTGFWERKMIVGQLRIDGLVCALPADALPAWDMPPFRVLDYLMDHDGALPPATTVAARLGQVTPSPDNLKRVSARPDPLVPAPFRTRWADDAEIGEDDELIAGGSLLVQYAHDSLVARDLWTGEVRWEHATPPRDPLDFSDPNQDRERVLAVLVDEAGVQLVYRGEETTCLRVIDADGRILHDVSLGLNAEPGVGHDRETIGLDGRVAPDAPRRRITVDRHTGELLFDVPESEWSPDEQDGSTLIVRWREGVFRVDPQTGAHVSVLEGKILHHEDAGDLLVVDHAPTGTKDYRTRALEQATGRVVWESERRGDLTYTPQFGGLLLGMNRDEAGYRVMAYRAQTGEALWSTEPLPASWPRLAFHREYLLFQGEGAVFAIRLPEGTVVGSLPLDLPSGPRPLSTRAGLVLFAYGLRCVEIG